MSRFIKRTVSDVIRLNPQRQIKVSFLAMVYKAFIAFSGYLSTRETRDKGIIDDFAFRLHYTFTTALLFLSSALISMSDLVGKISKKYLESLVKISQGNTSSRI